jgi:hypothetical protein
VKHLGDKEYGRGHLLKLGTGTLVHALAQGLVPDLMESWKQGLLGMERLEWWNLSPDRHSLTA